MILQFLNIRCHIRWIPVVCFVSVFCLLLRLGFWQLDRAASKQIFLAKQQAKMQQTPIKFNKLMTQEDSQYQKVWLQGVYDVQHQFLLDNQMQAGKLGAFVLTPFKIAQSDKFILVNRGWVPMDKARKKLPLLTFTPKSEQQKILGIINHFPSVGLVLKSADEPSKGWPSMVQIINVEKIKHKLQAGIFPFQIQLASNQSYGYVREWQVKTRMPPEKHRAYAFQWFALAATLFFLTLWMSCQVDKND